MVSRSKLHLALMSLGVTNAESRRKLLDEAYAYGNSEHWVTAGGIDYTVQNGAELGGRGPNKNKYWLTATSHRTDGKPVNWEGGSWDLAPGEYEDPWNDEYDGEDYSYDY